MALTASCLNWIHRKCNGTTLKEYNKLEAEDENIPWQCIICDIDDMASKFGFHLLFYPKWNLMIFMV